MEDGMYLLDDSTDEASVEFWGEDGSLSFTDPFCDWEKFGSARATDRHPIKLIRKGDYRIRARERMRLLSQWKESLSLSSTRSIGVAYTMTTVGVLRKGYNCRIH